MTFGNNYNAFEQPQFLFRYSKFSNNRFNPHEYDADISIEEDSCYLDYAAASELYDVFRMEL